VKILSRSTVWTIYVGICFGGSAPDRAVSAMLLRLVRCHDRSSRYYFHVINEPSARPV